MISESQEHSNAPQPMLMFLQSHKMVINYLSLKIIIFLLISILDCSGVKYCQENGVEFEGSTIVEGNRDNNKIFTSTI